MVKLVGAVVMALLALAPYAEAQTPTTEPQQAQVSRDGLRSLLTQYQQMETSRAYSAALRDRAKSEAALIADRLQEGDFTVGDRISLVVEGEQQLTDTFPVLPGRKLVLPAIGEIPLAGVLRSELPDYLRDRIGRFVVNPTVHARSLVRVYVSGSVGKPGFYIVPSESLLSDVLMAAGGPGQRSNIRQLTISRGTRVIWAGERLQAALREGRTLDQLSLRAGDQIELPEQRSRNTFLEILQYAMPVVSLITILVWRL